MGGTSSTRKKKYNFFETERIERKLWIFLSSCLVVFEFQSAGPSEKEKEKKEM
jgi:hypothetical protein